MDPNQSGGDPTPPSSQDDLTLPVDAATHAAPREQAAKSLSAALTGERAGDRIGPYVLMERLGAGGFGVVWRAERRETYVQQVAIKLLRPGMDSEAVLARFDQERQALAMMDHPNIAKVIDGGITENGRNYFVMELVKGEPITAFCDRHQLSIEKRLQLFAQACDAMQHAHMKGVIHRDLKPGNILASMGDTGDGSAFNGRVTIIDFGVAKATSPGLTARQVFTETGQMIGTPEYMSPEQADGGLDLDTRTDIYSLGVVLYELLVGAPPFDPASLRSAGLAAIHRVIRESDPMRPSERLGSLSRVTSAAAKEDTAATIARGRGMKSDVLIRVLRRELEWLPMKAMRKERSERYRSAAEFGDDVRNYMEGRALLAGPESSAYRVRKFVRRHRFGVLSAATIAASLLAATVISTWFGIREARARALAEQRERDVRQISEFQKDMLESLDPDTMGHDMKQLLEANLKKATAESPAAVRDQIERAFLEGLSCINSTDVSRDLLHKWVLPSADNISRSFHDQPNVEAGLRRVLAIALEKLGLFDEAAATQDAALALRPTEELDSTESLASLHWAGKIGSKAPGADKAKRMAQVRSAYEGLRGKRTADADDEALFALETLAGLTQNPDDALRMYADVERLAAEALQSRTNLNSTSRHALQDRVILSKASRLICLCKLKRAEEATRLADALELELPHYADLSERARLTVLTNISLARKVEQSIRPSAEHKRSAITAHEAVCKKSTELLGSNHPDTIGVYNNLATLHKDLGDPAAGIPILESRMPDWRTTVAGNPSHLRIAMNTLGQLYLATEQRAKGEPLVLEATKGVTVEGDPELFESRASLLAATDKLTEARAMYEQLIRHQQAANAGGVLIAQTLTELAKVDLRLSNLLAASAALEHAREVLDSNHVGSLSDTRWDVLNRLRNVYADRMKTESDDALHQAHKALVREIEALKEPRRADARQVTWPLQ